MKYLPVVCDSGDKYTDEDIRKRANSCRLHPSVMKQSRTVMSQKVCMNNMSIFKTFPRFSQNSFPTSASEKYIICPSKNNETEYARICEAV